LRLNIDGIVFPGSHHKSYSSGGWLTPLRMPIIASQMQVIVDSGTTLNYLPAEISNAINGAFDPQAEPDPEDGVYLVQCDANMQKVEVRLAGRPFISIKKI
jgi:hypothetical protein